MFAKFLCAPMNPASVLARARLWRKKLSRSIQIRNAAHANQQLKIAIVTCLYDTAFQDLELQITTKLRQIEFTFRQLPIHILFVLVIPDNDPKLAELRELFARLSDAYAHLSLESSIVQAGQLGRDCKGLQIKAGVQHALKSHDDIEFLCYLNLNIKVHVIHVCNALTVALRQKADFVVGTRVPGFGGGVLGAGKLGRLKSIVYNILVRGFLPELSGYLDTNAPLKLGTRKTWQLILDRSFVEDVSFDSEWLLTPHLNGLKVDRIPVLWIQQQGSRPPWTAIPRVVWALLQQSKARREGWYLQRDMPEN